MSTMQASPEAQPKALVRCPAMPIKEDFGQLVLRCVNYHGPEYAGQAIAVGPPGSQPQPRTTMAALPGWTIVPATEYGERIDLEHSTPVQLYVCRVCGYVEMYARPWNPPTGVPSAEPNFGRREFG